MTNFESFNQVKVMVPVVISQDWEGQQERPSPIHGESPEPSSRCGVLCGGCRGRKDCINCTPRCPPAPPELGWRKWCLFGIITSLILIVTINLALTLWIMSIMKFSNNGMGPLKIFPGGVQLSGKAYVIDSLYASSIGSRKGQPMVIESYQNFTVRMRNSQGSLQNQLFVDEEKLECKGKKFLVEDPNGKVLFSADPGEVAVGADALKILGIGGAIFEGSVETPMVRAESGKDLRLESLTRSLMISAAGELNIDSRGGSIILNSLNSVNIMSKKGSLMFNTSKIIMPKMPKAKLDMFRVTRKYKNPHRIYQLCICDNGRLFLASADGICQTFGSEDICR